MTKKCSNYLSLAVVALSVCLLTACQSSVDHSLPDSSKVGIITRQSEKVKKDGAESSTKSGSTDTQSSLQVPESNESSRQGLNSSNEVHKTATTPAQASTGRPEKRLDIPAVSPGAATGLWKNSVTEMISKINTDGQFADSTLVVAGVERGPEGQLTLHVSDTFSGVGVNFYYYPAGVPIPLQLVKTVDDKQVIEPIADPTDISRERIYSSNGIHLHVTQDQYDAFLEMVSYRP